MQWRREARSPAELNPLPEQEPVQGGKVQAGPASCWDDGLGESVLVSPWNDGRKCQMGNVRPSRREEKVLTEPISCREHWLHGAFSVFHPTSPSSL